MDITSVVTALAAFVPAQYAAYVMAACGACALVAALWKRPPDGSAWLPLYQLVSAVGMNFLHARNASAPSAAPKE